MLPIGPSLSSTFEYIICPNLCRDVDVGRYSGASCHQVVLKAAWDFRGRPYCGARPSAQSTVSHEGPWTPVLPVGEAARTRPVRPLNSALRINEAGLAASLSLSCARHITCGPSRTNWFAPRKPGCEALPRRPPAPGKSSTQGRCRDSPDGIAAGSNRQRTRWPGRTPRAARREVAAARHLMEEDVEAVGAGRGRHDAVRPS